MNRFTRDMVGVIAANILIGVLILTSATAIAAPPVGKNLPSHTKAQKPHNKTDMGSYDVYDSTNSITITCLTPKEAALPKHVRNLRVHAQKFKRVGTPECKMFERRSWRQFQ